MRGRRRALYSLAVLAGLLLAPVRAWACACCSHEGSYYVSSGRPSEYERSILQQVRFGRTANLYLTEADMEDTAKGLAHRVEHYELDGSLVGRVWRLAFRYVNHTGTPTLHLPSNIPNYAAPIHDGSILQQVRFGRTAN